MLDVPTDLALGGDLDDVAGAQGGVGVGDEVAFGGLEMLFGESGECVSGWKIGPEEERVNRAERMRERERERGASELF